MPDALVAVRCSPVQRHGILVVVGHDARVGRGNHASLRVDHLRQLVVGYVARPLMRRVRHQRHRAERPAQLPFDRGRGRLHIRRGQRVSRPPGSSPIGLGHASQPVSLRSAGNVTAQDVEPLPAKAPYQPCDTQCGPRHRHRPYFAPDRRR